MHSWLLHAIEAKDGNLLAAAGGGAKGAANLLLLLAKVIGQHHASALLSETQVEDEEASGSEVDEVDVPGVMFRSELPLAKKCADALMGSLPKEAVRGVMSRLPPPMQELLRDPSSVRDPEALIMAVHGSED